MKDRLSIPPTGYRIRIDHEEYEGYTRGPRAGEAFTLVDCWREINGTHNAHIISPTGRVALADAGSQRIRTWDMPNFAARRRNAARNLRAPYMERGTCDECGGLVYRDRVLARAWWHVPSSTCDIELTHLATPLQPRTGAT